MATFAYKFPPPRQYSNPPRAPQKPNFLTINQSAHNYRRLAPRPSTIPFLVPVPVTRWTLPLFGDYNGTSSLLPWRKRITSLSKIMFRMPNACGRISYNGRTTVNHAASKDSGCDSGLVSDRLFRPCTIAQSDGN